MTNEMEPSGIVVYTSSDNGLDLKLKSCCLYAVIMSKEPTSGIFKSHSS